MKISQSLPLFAIFDGYLLVTDKISAWDNFIDLDMKTFIGPDGFIFPFNRSFDSSSNPYTPERSPYWKECKRQLVLRVTGMFEEIWYGCNGEREIVPIPSEVKRYACHDNYIVNGTVSSLILTAADIDDLANGLEATIGMCTQMFTIYQIKDLVKVLNGDLAFEKLKSRKPKSIYKVIWLK